MDDVSGDYITFIGRTTVALAITDVNDNAPEFLALPFYASVNIDDRPGTLVKQVKQRYPQCCISVISMVKVMTQSILKPHYCIEEY